MDRNVTYRTILQALLIDFKSAGKSQQQIRNHESVLNKWLVFFEKSLDSRAVEFENLDKNVAEFIEGMKYGSKSIASKKYEMGNFHKVYLRLESNVDLPENFPKRLYFLMKKANVTCRQVADILGISSKSSVASWYQGKKNPSKKNWHQFGKLEQLLNAPEGSLTNLFKCWHSDPNTKRRRETKTQYAQLQSIRTVNRYRLAFDNWPAKAKDQWTSLLEHHTTEKAPVLPRNPDSIWHKANTVRVRLKLFECFFGFLTLPVELGGMGFESSDCDLRLIYEITEEGTLKFFEPYMDFHKKRTICATYPKGVYTTTLQNELKAIAVFINRKNGFMRNSKMFSDYISHIGLRWTELCEHSINRIVALYKNTKFQQVRYPNEPIAFILADQHPLKFLVSLVHNLERALPANFQRCYDRRLLNMYFVCSFLSAIPLRAQMLCNMRLHKNLYKDKNGNWRVRFDARDFKNDRFAAKDSDYDVACPTWLHTIINLYLENRSLFPGGKVLNGEFECEYVIRPCTSDMNHGEATNPVDLNTLFRWCITATSLYIPGCIGFGPHAWRHIVATDWIKNNPSGFQIAAKLLHDKIETVMKNYQHLLTSDWLIHYNIYSDSHFLINDKQFDS